MNKNLCYKLIEKWHKNKFWKSIKIIKNKSENTNQFMYLLDCSRNMQKNYFKLTCSFVLIFIEKYLKKNQTTYFDVNRMSWGTWSVCVNKVSFLIKQSFNIQFWYIYYYWAKYHRNITQSIIIQLLLIEDVFL